MKNWIYILLLGLVVACSDEEELTPSEVKNWYVITPTENMDEVDQKIYNLYTKYNLAVFYKDTIGSEDRGWKDENGNPKLYYEVLNLGYDISETGNVTNRFESIPVDVSTPEKKAEMIPLLELMDEKLFAWIDGAQVFIPAVLIVESMRKGYTDDSDGIKYNVYRGMGVLGFAMNTYDVYGEKADSLLQRNFLQQVCYGAMQDVLEDFQLYATNALEQNSSASQLFIENCWGAQVDEAIEGYSTNRKAYETQLNNKARVDQYVNRNKEIEELLKDETLSDTERAALESEYTLNETYISVYSKFYDEEQEAEYYAKILPYDARNYGFLDYLKKGSEGNYYFPTEEEDFNAFLDALLEYDEDEFFEMNADYPYVQIRYQLMKKTLEKTGLDVERIKADLNASQNSQK